MSVGMAHPDPPFHRVSQGCMQGAAWHWGLRWGLSWGRSHCSLHLRGHWWDSVPGRPLEWGPGFLAGWWMETLLGSLLQGSLPRRTRLHQSPWERERERVGFEMKVTVFCNSAPRCCHLPWFRSKLLEGREIQETVNTKGWTASCRPPWRLPTRTLTSYWGKESKHVCSKISLFKNQKHIKRNYVV